MAEPAARPDAAPARSLRRLGAAALVSLALVAAAACRPQAEALPEVPPGAVRVEIAGEPFALEVAADPLTQYRGLGGRERIDPQGGMLFVYPFARPLGMVMRDCAVPIDVAFLDGEGRVISIHEMEPEAPRAPGESPEAYEGRLRVYQSGLPARFAIETAGGRLREVGLRGGDRVEIDLEAVQRAASGT